MAGWHGRLRGATELPETGSLAVARKRGLEGPCKWEAPVRCSADCRHPVLCGRPSALLHVVWLLHWRAERHFLAQGA
eukprot:4591077-Pyramimonas_sp.AAC.1